MSVESSIALRGLPSVDDVLKADATVVAIAQ
jgi:hypothetical protein